MTGAPQQRAHRESYGLFINYWESTTEAGLHYNPTNAQSAIMPGLRVLAGPSPTSLVPITDLVNTNEYHTISTEHFEGQVAVNIKGFTDTQGNVLDSEYFQRENRKDTTWSIQVQGTFYPCIDGIFPDELRFSGRFLQPHSSDDILFGNMFDRPLNLPWGSSAVLKLMR